MYPNTACSVLGCTDPVIGQCPGYKGGCGRYYCATHSADGLCADCTRRKLEDDIYDDYLQTSERLKLKMVSSSEGNSILIGIVFIDLLALLVLPYVATALVGVVIFVSGLFWVNTRRRELEKAEVAEIDKEKPAFSEFYKAWQKQRDKDALMAGLAIAGVIVAGTIAAAAESSSRERRVSEIEEGVRRAMR